MYMYMHTVVNRIQHMSNKLAFTNSYSVLLYYYGMIDNHYQKNAVLFNKNYFSQCSILAAYINY